MNTTTTETISLNDMVRFRDTDGVIRSGYVCCTPDHEFSCGNYNLSVARYAGLVAVSPKDIVGKVAAYLVPPIGHRG